MQNNISNISNFNFNFNFLKSTTWAYYIRYSHTKTDNIFLPFIYIMIWCNDSQTLPTRFHSIRFVLFYFTMFCFDIETPIEKSVFSIYFSSNGHYIKHFFAIKWFRLFSWYWLIYILVCCFCLMYVDMYMNFVIIL